MPAPLKANERRKAVHAIRGYLYQIWRSLYTWITLSPDQVLYLEGAEDLDKISAQLANATQVKATAERLSLGRREAQEALDHYLSLKERNPGRAITYCYLTTASAGTEKGHPFGKNTTGITLWKNCQRSGRDAEIIIDYLLQSKHLPERVRTFIQDHTRAEVLRELIEPISWETSALPQADIERLVLEQLVYRGDDFGIPPSEAEKAVNRLLRVALETATQPERRELTKAKYYSIFEEETSIRVPRAAVQFAPRASRGFLDLSRHGATLPLSCWTQSTPPPSLESIAARESVVSDLDSFLRRTGLLVLTGSTGMGKTTLAKQIVADTNKLLWISLRSMPVESRSHFCLSLALGAPSALEAGAVVVLDDLQSDWFSLTFHDDLAHALIVLREMNVLIVVTTPASLPQSFVRKAGLSQKSERSAPPFSRAEIESFAERMGCAEATARDWSGIIEMHSRGHPQLVHTHLVSLQVRGWPNLAEVRDEILQSPNEVRREREDVRTQLLSGLPQESARLVHYLSLLGSLFRRDHAIAVGEELATIAAPGLAFDALLGPWVEALHNDYFQVSPLLQNAYESVFSSSTITKTRYTLAEIFAHTGTATTIEASSALMCAILGRNAKILGLVSHGLIQSWSEKVGPTIASYLSWLTPIHLEGQSLLEWCAPKLSSIFRMLQFRVASLEAPQLCDRIVRRWDVEAAQLKSPQERLVHQYSLCMAVVYGLAGKASLECTLPFILRLGKLRREASGEASLSEIMTAPEVPQDAEALFKIYPSCLDFLTVMQRVQTVADVDITIQFLDGLRKTDRDNLLAPIIDDVIEPSFLHRPWVNESRQDKPSWPPVLEQLRTVMEHAESWGSQQIYRTAALGIVIIESEHLSRFQAAHELLRLVEEKCGSSFSLLEQRATVLHVENRHEEALAIWLEIFRMQRPHPLLPEGLHAPGFVLSRRKAAISAASIGRWAEAVVLFQDACHWAYVMVDRSYQAALKTDAVFCAFKGENTGQAVELLDSAVTEIARLIEERVDADVQITQRMIAHLLLWLTTGSLREVGEAPTELAEPWVGFCSNPERLKDIDKLPLMPIDLLYTFLCQAEEKLAQRSLIFEREKDRLARSSTPVVRYFTHDLDMRKDFRRNDFRRFPEKVSQFIRAGSPPMKHFLEMKERSEAERQTEMSTSRLFVESREGGEPEFGAGLSIDILVAALLCLRLRAADEEQAVMEEWGVASRSAAAFWPELPGFLALIQEARGWSLAEAKEVLRTWQRDRNRRMLSALVVGTSSDSDADTLFYAHALLLDVLSQGLVKEEVAGCLAGTLERQWRRLANVPALLRTPPLSVPAILEACDSSAKGHRKSAQILMTADLAVRMTLPREMMERFRDAAQ